MIKKVVLILFTLLITTSVHSASIHGEVQFGDERAINSTLTLKLNEQVIATTTDLDNGIYRFDNLSAGLYSIEVTDEGKTVTGSSIDLVSENTVVNHNFWLVPAENIIPTEIFELSGTISDYSGNLYPGTVINFFSKADFRTHRVVADESGKYSINLPAGPYEAKKLFKGHLADYPDTYLLFNSDGSNQIIDVAQQMTKDFVIPFKEVGVSATNNGNETSVTLSIAQRVKSPTDPFETDYFVVYHPDTNKKLLMPAHEDIEVTLSPNKFSQEGTFMTEFIIPKITADASVENYDQPLNTTGVVLDISGVKDLDGNSLTDVCVRVASDRFGSSISSCDSADGKLYLQPGNYYFSLLAENPQWGLGSQDEPSLFLFSFLYELELEQTESPITSVSKSFIMPVRKVDIKVTNKLGESLANMPVVLEQADGTLTSDLGMRSLVDIDNVAGSTNSAGLLSLYVNPEVGSLFVRPSENSGLNEKGVSLRFADSASLLTIQVPNQIVDPATEEGNFVFGRLESLAADPISGSIPSFVTNGVEYSNTVKDGFFSTAINDETFSLFSVELPKNDVIDELTSPQSIEIDLRVSTIGPTRKDIIVPILQIKGRVFDSFGNPVQGIAISSDSTFSANVDPTESTDFHSRLASVSDSSGSFSNIALPGKTGLYVRALDFDLNRRSYQFQRNQVTDNSSVDIIILHDNPIEVADSDGDKIPNYYETEYGRLDPTLDEDNDSLNNLQEANLSTNPYLADSDGDGITDADDGFPLIPNEWTNPDLSFDADNDGFSQLQEVIIGTDPYDSTETPQPISEVMLADENLQACLDATVLFSEIQYVNQLWSLTCNDSDVVSLEGLEQLTFLSNFSASQNSITDASALSGLTSLSRISLNQNAITDISVFSGLSAVYQLYLDDNEISDLTGFSDLPSLRVLFLDNNNIVDISPLASFDLLQSLNLRGNDGITCTTNRSFQGVNAIPAICIRPDLFESRGIVTILDFESQVIDPAIQFVDDKWTIDNSGFESEFSLQISDLDANDMSSFSITKDTPEGLISFDLLTDSDACCDRLRFYIDDKNQNVEYTKGVWQTYDRIVEPGMHTFRWEYSNATQYVGDSEYALIDNITFPNYFKEQLNLLPDLNNNSQNSIGRLSFDRETKRFNLEVESLDGNGLQSLINWPVAYKDVDLQVIRTGEDPAVGLFGIREDAGFEGRAQFFVRSALTGARVNVFNWPANWSEIELKLLPDLNGDGVAEVAIQGRFKEGNRPQLVVKNGADGTNLRVFQFPDLWNDPEYMAFSDVTDDGVPEIALFGFIKRNGKPQVRIIDGTNPDNKLKSYTFPNIWENVSWNRLSDSNGDGEDDWGMFGRRLDDGRSQLVVKDARSPRGALRIFAWSAGFDNATFYSIPDMNNDGIDEVAAGGYRSDINRYQMTVKDGADRNVTLANYGWPNNWSEVSLHVLADVSGDGISEIALFGKATNSKYQMVIKHGDISQGEQARVFIDRDWAVKPILETTLDSDDDGLSDMIFIGADTQEQNIIFELGSSSIN